MSIREILVKKDCPICKGRENGCYDCSSKGYIKEWVPLVEVINDMKMAIEHGRGIL